MPAYEYVYVICQNARTGKVVTIRDNRDQLDEEMMNNVDLNATSFFDNMAIFSKK